MSMLERAAQMIANIDERNGAGPWGSPWCDQQENREKAEAAFQELRLWLDHQLQHGCAPDGHPVAMTPEYEMGRRSAFEAIRQLLSPADSARFGGEK